MRVKHRGIFGVVKNIWAVQCRVLSLSLDVLNCCERVDMLNIKITRGKRRKAKKEKEEEREE